MKEKHKKRLRQTAFSLLVAALFAWPSFGLAANDLDELLRLAYESNPDLAALETQVKAMKQRTEAVRIWPDPIFSMEYSNAPYDTLALDESPMSGVQFALRQTIPTPGLNDRREAVAEAEAKVKKWEFAERKLQLAGLVRQTYWRLALTRQLEKLTRDHLVLVEQLARAVQAGYQIGHVGQQDLQRLQILQDKLRDDLLDFTSDEEALTAMLNTALYRTVDTPIETPDAIPGQPPAYVLNDLMEKARAQRPLLKMWRATARMKQLAADRTRSERFSDFSVRLGYRLREEQGMDPGDDFVSLGIAVPLPFDYTNRWRAQNRTFLMEAEAARQQYEAVFNQIRGALRISLAHWRRAVQKVTTYQEILVPGAKNSLESALAAWQTNRTDFTALYQAQTQLIDFDRAIAQAQFVAIDMQISVETLIGETGN